jgi:glycosyltransferase involved in cell wall biosynthesis
MLVSFDIAIAPLKNIEFNKAKSDLKYLEYAMAGLPVVASDIEAYNKTIIHGQNGFLAKSEEEWFKYLSLLIEDYKLREKIGRAARAYAETRTIEKNIHLWEEAYGL